MDSVTCDAALAALELQTPSTSEDQRTARDVWVRSSMARRLRSMRPSPASSLRSLLTGPTVPGMPLRLLLEDCDGSPEWVDRVRAVMRENRRYLVSLAYLSQLDPVHRAEAIRPMDVDVAELVGLGVPLPSALQACWQAEVAAQLDRLPTWWTCMDARLQPRAPLALAVCGDARGRILKPLFGVGAGDLMVVPAMLAGDMRTHGCIGWAVYDGMLTPRELDTVTVLVGDSGPGLDLASLLAAARVLST